MILYNLFIAYFHQISVDVFGRQMSTGYFPYHFFITNGYDIKDLLKGDVAKSWPEPPKHLGSYCSYKVKRTAALLEQGIQDVQPVFLDTPDVIWIGSHLIGDKEKGVDTIKDMKR